MNLEKKSLFIYDTDERKYIKLSLISDKFVILTTKVGLSLQKRK